MIQHLALALGLGLVGTTGTAAAAEPEEVQVDAVVDGVIQSENDSLGLDTVVGGNVESGDDDLLGLNLDSVSAVQAEASEDDASVDAGLELGLSLEDILEFDDNNNEDDGLLSDIL
jgi:hypothetical protein